MIRKFLLPVLMLLGIAFSLFMIYRGTRQLEEPAILFAPPTSPYVHAVAGEGLIESFDENIQVSVPFPDLIMDVYVKVGDKVEEGTPLFKLDTRQPEADLAAARAQLNVAEVELADATKRFSFFQQLQDKNAVSQEEYARVCYAQKRAEEQVIVAKANVERIETVIRRSIICAPITGEVLQKNARIGEFANVNPFDREQLVIFGNTRLLQLRAQVAEEDAWRIIKGAPATAFVRGNSAISIPLTFRYIEPYIVPKRSLTGSDFERVDTRVLEIVYAFNKDEYPIYVGQLLDVYIEAKPSTLS